MLNIQCQIKTPTSLQVQFICCVRSLVRTPGALERHCYYPSWLHGYIQVRFLARGPEEWKNKSNYLSQQKKGCVSEKFGFVGFNICIK